jgi:hypothetical protein
MYSEFCSNVVSHLTPHTSTTFAFSMKCNVGFRLTVHIHVKKSSYLTGFYRNRSCIVNALLAFISAPVVAVIAIS